MAQDPKQIIDTVMDTQKGMVDTMVENTRKMTSGNTAITETLEKGSEWYKNWLDTQKNFFGQTTQKMTEAGDQLKENTQKAQDSWKESMDRQNNMMRQMYDINMNWMKNAMPNAQQFASSNPFEQFTAMWQNGMTNWQNAMNQGNAMNTWMQNMQKMNPFSGNNFQMPSFDLNGMMSQWNDLLTNSVKSLQNAFKPGTAQDAYRNMSGMADNYARFTQMIAPMWKSIQDKSFTPELFRKALNPAQYKEMLDQYMGFLPENMRTWMQQSSAMMQDMTRQWNETLAGSMTQGRNMMSSFMPGTSDMFGNMLNGYNSLYSNMQNALAPMNRMATPSQFTKNAAEWSDIANRMVQFSIRNAEMQAMVYEKGQQVMEQLGKNIADKIQNGQEIDSMTSLYQEWMSISDKSFVELFESEAYSEVMAEVSSMQLRLKKDIELQMENMMSGLPVATRSELDELYKTIYDLKKQVRQLEKMMEVEGDNDNIADTQSNASNTENNNAQANGLKGKQSATPARK